MKYRGRHIDLDPRVILAVVIALGLLWRVIQFALS